MYLLCIFCVHISGRLLETVQMVPVQACAAYWWFRQFPHLCHLSPRGLVGSGFSLIFLKLSVCIYKLVDAPHCDFLFFRWADCVNLCGNTAAPIKLVLGWLASTAVVRSYLCRNQGFCLLACLGQESSAYCKTGFSVRFSVCCYVEQECAFCWFLCSFFMAIVCQNSAICAFVYCRICWKQLLCKFWMFIVSKFKIDYTYSWEH